MPSSRRHFLAAGLALPAAASATRSADSPQQQSPAPSRLSSGPSFQYRTLGKTGLKVTTVGFGCMITSDGSVVERAADLGITYFDTARGYMQGNNERMVGAALKAKRNQVTLSTKSHAGTREDALKDLDTSLKELGTDHVDIWYLHAKSRPDEVTDELIDAQQTAKKAGKIRFAGVSTHSGQATLIPWLAKHEKIDVVLSAYNFTMEPAVTDALETAAKAGKGVVAMKIMAGGNGTGRGGRGRGGPNPNAEKLKQAGAMAAVLRWVTRNPNVHTTVPSMTDMDQLDENIKAGVQAFSDADAKLLAVRREVIRPFYCNMCGQCDGSCCKGLPVQDVLRFVTYAEGYGQFALGRERFLELPAAHAAVRCNDCPVCTVKCPHGVQVAERLIRAQELFAC
ncbi:MAG TPA: aldo/keto reductase [Candidatus Acidoferrales bacterium]|nr:aldo/keto reductase [Candidatus Acidoferrales bacterium]